MTAQLQQTDASPGLTFDDVVVPGERVDGVFTVTYDGNVAPRGFIELRVSPAGTFDVEAVRLNGAPAAAHVNGCVMRVATPPVSPGDVLTVTFQTRIAFGLRNGDPLTITALARAGGWSCSLEQSARVRAHASVSATRSTVSLDGVDVLQIGRPATVCIALVNDGSAAAESVTLRVAKSRDVVLGALPTIGSFPVGDTRVAYVTLTATGPKPSVTFEAVIGDVAVKLPTLAPAAREGARITCQLAATGALPVPATGHGVQVLLNVENTGDVSGDVVVLLSLPAGVSLRGARDGIDDIVIGTLEAGEAASRALLLDVDARPRTSFTIVADTVVDGRVHGEEARISLEPQTLTSVCLHDFSIAQAARTGDVLPTQLIALCDGNAVTHALQFDVQFGAGLAFAGNLEVNGVPVDCEPRDVTLHDVEAGTMVALQWNTRAIAATPRGATTALSARLTADACHLDCSTQPLTIAPAVVNVRRKEDLPFTIGIAKTSAAQEQLAQQQLEAASAAHGAAAPAADPMPEDAAVAGQTSDASLDAEDAAHGVAASGAVESEPVGDAGDVAPSAPETTEVHTNDETPAGPVLNPPSEEALRSLRRRLALATSQPSFLGLIIGDLGALADAGTHPADADYANATRALRKATTHAASGLSTPALMQLKADLQPFARVIANEQPTLLECLTAIADSLASSSNPSRTWWPAVRDFARICGDALRAAQAANPNFDLDVTVDINELHEVRHAHAALVKAIPV